MVMIHFLRCKLQITLITLLLPNFLFAQEKPNQAQSFDDVIEALEKQTYDLVQEKVYLHFDKPYYSKGENLWFKAYTVAGPNHTPTPLSENLYVELINPDGEVLKRHTINLSRGLGKGDFHLNDSLNAGNYTVRAYTNWMRNFNEDFFFTKDIKLLDSSRSQEVDANESTSEPTVRFFPEGGELIANVKSRVAFEISDDSGKALKGGIFDEEDNLITRFQTEHLGLGSFNFIPSPNVRYHAKLNDHSEKYILPPAKSSGLGLMVDQNEEFIIVKISSPKIPTIGNHTAFLLAHTRGLIGFSSRINWNDQQATIRISKDKLAAGIVHITLFDEQWRPEAERLIFKETSDAITVDISTESSVYSPRDSTTLKIKVVDENGDPHKGFFSLAAVDTRQIDVNQYNDNIISSFLFSSDLNNKISNPVQYFNSQNATRTSEIDLLLLTQGWRRFLWKDILNDVFADNNHPVERGFKLSGVVTTKNQKRVKKGLVKQLGSFDGIPSFAQATIQNDGSFEINNLKYYGSDIILKAQKGKNSENVIVNLDSIPSQNFPNSVRLNQLTNKSTALEEFYTQQEERELYDEAYDLENISAFLESSRQRKIIDSTFNFDNSRDLGEFTVEGNKFKNRDRPDRSRGLVFGAGAYSLDASELTATGQRFRNVISLLQGRVPGLKIITNQTGEPTVRLNRPVGFTDYAAKEPLFLLDDSPIPLAAATALKAEDMKRVEIFKGVQAFHLYGSSGENGVIAFYTKTPEEQEADRLMMAERQDRFSTGNQHFSIPNGYYLARQFYAPNYGKKLPKHIKPDRRALIHWEPMIETNANGEAEVTFYNADLETTIQVNLEGIWEGGIPLTATTTYQVRKDK